MAHVSCHSSSQNVGASMRLISIEQLREWDIFKIGLLYTEQEKCSYKPILKEKIHVLMQVCQLDTKSHNCFAWVLMTGPKANQNPSITWCTHCSDLQITANQIIFHIFQEKPVWPPYTITNGESQTPLLWFLLRRGGRLYIGYIPGINFLYSGAVDLLQIRYAVIFASFCPCSIGWFWPIF